MALENKTVNKLATRGNMDQYLLVPSASSPIGHRLHVWESAHLHHEPGSFTDRVVGLKKTKV